MMNRELLKLLQKHIATSSIGPSTARGMGPKGTIKAARSYLAWLDLSKFSVSREEEFRQVLNRATRELVKKLPQGGRHWGSARKFMNIFLRYCVYNRHLCAAYKLKQIEPWLEVPLDSHIAKGLRNAPGGKALPPLGAIIRLDPRKSRHYQSFASEIAKQKKIHRVHLDLVYWRRDDGKEAESKKSRP